MKAICKYLSELGNDRKVLLVIGLLITSPVGIVFFLYLTLREAWRFAIGVK